MYARFIRTPTHFKVTVTVTVTPLYAKSSFYRFSVYFHRFSAAK